MKAPGATMRRALPSFFAATLLLLPGCIHVPGGFEWVVIAFIALLLFGGSKLPGLMRSMGAGISEFKKGLKEGAEPDSLEGGGPDGDKKELEAGGSSREEERTGGGA